MNLDLGRLVADAVLYEGYLLYPYRASSSKNQSRWQFGVLSPPDAEAQGFGEASSMSMQCVVSGAVDAGGSPFVVHLRFLHLQRRQVLDLDGAPIDQITQGDMTWMSWDEAVEEELTFPVAADDLRDGASFAVHVPAGEDLEALTDQSGTAIGTIARRRQSLVALLRVDAEAVGDLHRLTVAVDNVYAEPTVDKDDAIARALIGTHVIIEAHGPSFVSLLEPPDEASAAAAAACAQQRCWPVLGGMPGETDLLLGLPIILYDYPEIAEQSTGALFDSTEIDEILTLRVLTMTDEEKAEARATDPKAREIIDRCEQMSPEAMQAMHGILRDPGALPGIPAEPDFPVFSDVRNVDPPSFQTGDSPWWDPEQDESVSPDTDAVMIQGIRVAKGSLVRVQPNRRADAQDMFSAGMVAKVTAVLSDVDGGTHLAVVLVDDPAADMHDWYGRYLYFAPDELEPLPAESTHENREEIRPWKQ